MSDATIPLFRPDVTSLERANLTRVLDSGWWGLGPETARFEEEFAAYARSRSPGCPQLHAVATSSGTAALEIAVRALGLQPGDRAIVPPLTFVSTATAMVHAGLTVEFCDIDEATLCLDWAQAAQRAADGSTGNTVIVPVWYSGTVTPVPAGLPAGTVVLEDCAHAAGSARAGAAGEAGAWSFHAVKNLAAGDGGMITFRSPDAARHARALRWCGISKSTHDRVTRAGYGWDYTVQSDGQKAHMNDITAAIARAQLARLPVMNARRRAIARAYNAVFTSLDWLRCPVIAESSATHMYVVRVPAAARPAFITHLLERGVSAGVHYRPLYHYRALFPAATPLPVTERTWPRLVTLPLFPSMTSADMDRVITAVLSFRPAAGYGMPVAA